MRSLFSAAQDKGMPLVQVEDALEKFEYFSGYGFNKSHAVSYSIISYQCAWLCHYYTTEWVASFLDKEPESRKEKAINLAKQHGYTIQPLSVNKSGRTWEILDETTLVAPLTTIKGLGDKAIDQILAHRPFETIEEFLFHDEIVYSKLNKKCLDALARLVQCENCKTIASLETSISGLRLVLTAQGNLKILERTLRSIVQKATSQMTSELIFANLTGIFPINLVIDESHPAKVRPLLYSTNLGNDPDLGMCWCDCP